MPETFGEMPTSCCTIQKIIRKPVKYLKLNTVYNEDCLIGMSRIPDHSIDLLWERLRSCGYREYQPPLHRL
jgi:hypothetical protein